jgi:GAF domain-containing protein
LPFDRAGIFLLNPEGDLLRGTWGVDDEGAIVPIPDTVFPLNPVRAEDISEAAQVARGELEYFLTQDLDKERRSSIEGNIQASLTVPMRAGERVIGVLVADNYFSSRPIGKEQVQSLRILANQGAAALENARLYQVLQTAHGELEKRIAQRTLELSRANEELITRHRDLSLLMNTSQIASESLDLQTVLNQIADALQRHLDCDIVEIYTVDQDRYQVQLWSYRELWVDDTREQASFPIGEGLSGWVAAHRESIRIGRPVDDPRGISNSAPVKAFLGVPVNFEDQIVGVLSVSRFDDDQFGDGK